MKIDGNVHEQSELKNATKNCCLIFFRNEIFYVIYKQPWASEETIVELQKGIDLWWINGYWNTIKIPLAIPSQPLYIQ